MTRAISVNPQAHLRWIKTHRSATLDHLGFIPYFLSEKCEGTACEQLEANYAHGGGWNPISGFKMLENGNLKYPGDPETQLLWETTLRDETIRVYEHAWVAIVQPSGDFEVARMD